MHLRSQGKDFRAAINTRSSQAPSELLYLLVEDFRHSMLAKLLKLPPGFSSLAGLRAAPALDYVRGGLFDPGRMIPLPHSAAGPDNDLNDKLDHWVRRAMADPKAELFVFGEPWGPDSGKDKVFGFRPKRGIHDVHMNQGNSARFRRDDGIWQDGGLLFHFPDRPNKWVAVFLAFQSQCWQTSTPDGHCLDQPSPGPVSGSGLMIASAVVNPKGQDEGKESVTLINFGADDLDLSGYGIADHNRRASSIGSAVIRAGKTLTIRLDGKGARLGNQGGVITLLDSGGEMVHQVSYSKSQAKKSGRSIVF